MIFSPFAFNCWMLNVAFCFGMDIFVYVYRIENRWSNSLFNGVILSWSTFIFSEYKTIFYRNLHRFFACRKIVSINPIENWIRGCSPRFVVSPLKIKNTLYSKNKLADIKITAQEFSYKDDFSQSLIVGIFSNTIKIDPFLFYQTRSWWKVFIKCTKTF